MPEALPEMSTDYATALLKDFDEELARLEEQVDGAPQAPRRPGPQTRARRHMKPAGHHRASRPAYSARGRAGEYTGVLDETEALSA